MTVLVTGHTGFKGGWLSLWLTHLAARVVGYALEPPTHPSFFEICRLSTRMVDIRGDVNDFVHLRKVFRRYRPAIVFHLAAQSLVRRSFADPVGTYATNVLGTINVLEAAREAEDVRAVVVVTSDKCYSPKKGGSGYREDDALGGRDPYSGSKACAEIAAESYRYCFFQRRRPPVFMATVRAGNVIGGGDWGQDRLVPDCIRALVADQTLMLRYPRAKRPWQHVLSALSGYLLLGGLLYHGEVKAASSWNFGPAVSEVKPVKWIVQEIGRRWGKKCCWKQAESVTLPESPCLKLNCRKARSGLGWRPGWNLDEALDRTVAWYQRYYQGQPMTSFSLTQIREFEQTVKEKNGDL